jgi:tight adherence protein B
MKIWVLLAAGMTASIFAWTLQRVFYQALSRYRETYTHEAEHRLRDLFLFVDPSKLWSCAWILALMVCLILYGLQGGWFVSVGLGIVCLFVPQWLLSWARRHRIALFEQQLPDALLALSSTMRSGSSLSTALQGLVQHSMAPLSQEFAVVNREVRLGVPLQDAVESLAKRLPGEALRMFATTVRVASRSGGPMAVVLEQTARTLLANQQIVKRLSALMAQGKLQAWVMGAMPIALMLVMAGLDDRFSEALLGHPFGQTMLVIVIGLEALGIWWIRQIAQTGQSASHELG